MNKVVWQLRTVAVRLANVMQAVEAVLAGLALYVMECIAR